MADLNDFFAKKDKKKKGGKKFSKANTDVLAKNLVENDLKKVEDSTKNYALPEGPAASEDPSQAKQQQQPAEAAEGADPGQGARPGVSTVGGGQQQLQLQQRAAAGYKSFGLKDKFEMNDDEWLSYDDDKKDYSGLKIESLKVEERGGSEEEEEEHEINEEGEKVRVKRPEGGPWNKAAAGPKKDEDEAQEEVEEKKSAAAVAAAAPAPAEAPGSAAKSSYVPPHLRGGPPSSGPAPGGPGGSMSVNSRMNARRANRAAPDINSEVFFPSLGADEGKVSKKGGRMDNFEEVRSGGGGGHGSGSRGSNRPGVALGNKFAALRGD